MEDRDDDGDEDIEAAHRRTPARGAGVVKRIRRFFGRTKKRFRSKSGKSKKSGKSNKTGKCNKTGQAGMSGARVDRATFIQDAVTYMFLLF